MVLHRLSLVLLSLFLSHPQRPLCIAAPQSNGTGFTVDYTLTTANSPDCEPSLVDNFPVRVQYRTIIGTGDGGQSNISVSEWMDSVSPNMPETINVTDCEANLTTSAADMPVHVTVRSYSLLFPSDIDHINSSQRVQLRLVQSDHRGGFCDCWAVSDLKLKFMESNFSSKVPLKNKRCAANGGTFATSTAFLGAFMISDDTIICTNQTISESFLGFCRGSASIPRGFVSVELSAQSRMGCKNTAAVVDTGRAGPLMGDQCDSLPHVRVNFNIQISSSLTFDEGVEFAFKNLNHGGEWVPLMFYCYNSTQRDVKKNRVGSQSLSGDFVSIRGYNVPFSESLVGSTNAHRADLKLCDRDIMQNNASLGFRWLQTVTSQTKADLGLVYLDNITISINSSEEYVLLMDDFNNATMINSERWTGIRRVSLEGSDREYHLKFGMKAPTFAPLNNNRTIISREISTVPLYPNLLTTSTTTAVTNISTDKVISTPTPANNDRESIVLSYNKATKLNDIYDLIHNNSESLTGTLVKMFEVPMDLIAAVYLLSAIGNTLGNQTVQPAISEMFLSTASGFLDITQRQNERKENDSIELRYIAGSTLLQTVDDFALNNHNASHQITSDNIVFHVEEVSVNETRAGTLSPIQGEDAEIIIPIREVLVGLESGAKVRMAALLFQNMSGLLPENVVYEERDLDDVVFRLASPVISASFQCDTCTTSNLSTPVQVTFKHIPYDQALLGDDLHGLVKCVFWQFEESSTDQPGAIFYPGNWSEEGCETNFNSTMTVCKCNHLTHFAILLSARPLKISQQKILSLQIIGYIGVSISLVAMVATAFVFIFLKALHTMRNYIHIQLCVTLGIAQIIFVAGIEPRLGERHLVGGVPVGCRLVAVLLHYWFLVSFMWMLMEGVVLYVALVRVFVKNHARYVAAFTIASYGLPLLYVGGLTAPLGFVRSEQMLRYKSYDYGYEQACYMNPATSFIWSFIAPVILIILANIGFFIMVLVIMNRHQNKQPIKNKVKKLRHWLKVSISLTVVMGITWIIGVLVIEVKELFALTFIFTILVAFQGLFIFIIFVLLSKQVRETYQSWWKAKVAESDFLSSYFGEKRLTLGTSASVIKQDN